MLSNNTKKIITNFFFIYLINNVTCLNVTNNINDITLFVNSYLLQPVTLVTSNPDHFTFLHDLNITRILLNPSNVLQHVTKLEISTSFILIEKDCATLTPTLAKLKELQNWNSRRKFLILFKNQIPKNDLKACFSELWQNHSIFNVASFSENLHFQTWYPYAEESNCGREIVLEPTTRIIDPFMEKIPKKLNGCTIRVGWNVFTLFTWNPYNKYPGALFQFFNIVAEKLGLEVVYLNDTSEFVTRYLVTGNYEEIEEEVKLKKIDLVLYAANRGNYMRLEHTQDMFRAITYIFLPTRRKIIRSNFIVNLFSDTLLLGIAIALAVSLLFWRILTGDSYSQSLYSLFQILIVLSLRSVPRRISAKTFFIFLLTFSIYLNISYNSHLSSVLTKPHLSPKITNIEEFLATDNLVLKTFPPFIKFIAINPGMTEVVKSKCEYFPKHYRIYDIIDDFVKYNSFAIHTTNYHFSSFRNLEKLEYMKDAPLIEVEYIGAVREGFPLLDSINRWITIVKQTGILDKYLFDASIPLKKYVLEDPTQLSLIKLDLNHLKGAFLVLVLGFIISSVVFAIEVKFMQR